MMDIIIENRIESFFGFSVCSRVETEKPKFEKIRRLGPKTGVFLHQGLNKLLGLLRNMNGIVNFLLIHLHIHICTFRIFYITIVFLSPSKGALPVSN
jgi:hypothetical protein